MSRASDFLERRLAVGLERDVLARRAGVREAVLCDIEMERDNPRDIGARAALSETLMYEESRLWRASGARVDGGTVTMRRAS